MPAARTLRDHRKAAVGVATAALLLGGCNGVLDPHGPIGTSARLILIDSLAIMLVIVAPLIAMIFAFAWWFRASNRRAVYRPQFDYSGQLELIVWAIPGMVVTFLGGLAWFGSHTLDPYKPITSARTALEIEVVALDWKWLFIYPDEGVATVNELVVPVGTPLHFRLTSAGVMNSFFVPQLGSQMYAMAGMVSQLNLQADEAGSYHGLSAQFSGEGFADMQFEVRALSLDRYAEWLQRAKAQGPSLDHKTYAALAIPTTVVQPTSFRAVLPGLFAGIVQGNSPPPNRPGPHTAMRY